MILKLLNRGAIVLILNLVWGCESSDQIEMNRARDSYQIGKYSESLAHYKRVIKKSHDKKQVLEAAKNAALISFQDLKDYKEALSFYKFVVVESADTRDQFNAQKQIAEIYYSHLSDYPNSISEYSRLIDQTRDSKEQWLFRYRLAKAYYYTNQFFQAQVEAEKILKSHPNESYGFDALLLLAHISMSDKKTDRAIEYYERLMSKYPQRSKKEQIALNLGMGYEEIKNYDKAIQIYQDAQSYYPTPEFLKLRIQKLKSRKSQLPGAQGFKK